MAESLYECKRTQFWDYVKKSEGPKMLCLAMLTISQVLKVYVTYLLVNITIYIILCLHSTVNDCWSMK